MTAAVIGASAKSPIRTFCAAPTPKDVAALRVSYSSQGIDKTDVSEDPYDLFKVWFAEACEAKVIEPNAMCLSTCKDNIPTARYVLLKAHDERGFVWYTNYNSRKSADLRANPVAAITFWWGDLERSIRIEGAVECVSAAESDAYFQSRPRGSRLGAWSSNQSSPVDTREELAKQEQDVISKFEGQEDIPRPPHWGGFRLVPTRIEFWKGRENRMHDRLVYERDSAQDDWKPVTRLQP